MEIEILQNDRMAQDGHSILRSLQNDEIHPLDLLVREFTQNSLDAALSKEDGIKLLIDTGTFSKRSFWKKLMDLILSFRMFLMVMITNIYL